MGGLRRGVRLILLRPHDVRVQAVPPRPHERLRHQLRRRALQSTGISSQQTFSSAMILERRCQTLGSLNLPWMETSQWRPGSLEHLDTWRLNMLLLHLIAELAGLCTSREPLQQPDMGHAVTVLVPMVEKWKPSSNEVEDYMGIDLHLPLFQMVKGWQESEASMMTDGSILSLEDSKGSIPAWPAGFAESFTSADGR